MPSSTSAVSWNENPICFTSPAFFFSERNAKICVTLWHMSIGAQLIAAKGGIVLDHDGCLLFAVWLVIRSAQAAANNTEDPVGPPCSICGSIPLLAHHPILAQAVRFLGILADAFKQCTALGRKTTAKGGKDCHFRIRDTTRLSTFMGCGLE